MALATIHKTVAVAGTPEALSITDRPCYGVVIQAKNANTGKVWCGVTGLTKATFVGVGHELAIPTANLIPSVSISSPMPGRQINLKDVILDVDVNGDGVTAWIVE